MTPSAPRREADLIVDELTARGWTAEAIVAGLGGVRLWRGSASVHPAGLLALRALLFEAPPNPVARTQREPLDVEPSAEVPDTPELVLKRHQVWLKVMRAGLVSALAEAAERDARRLAPQ